MDEIKTKHESFGMIGISRSSSNTKFPLFGSSIKHSNTIRLKIKKCEVTRSLHREWYYGYEPIIEVELSAAQFSEFITTPNVGDGVPCTIRYVNNVRMEDPPFEGKVETFQNEFKSDLKSISEKLNSVSELLNDSINRKSVKLSDLKVILDKLKLVKQDINSNLPFVYTQFNEQVQNTMVEAKSEIDSFVTTMIHKTGLEMLRTQLPSIEKEESVERSTDVTIFK